MKNKTIEFYKIKEEKMDNVVIGKENERFTVKNLVRESFWNVYRPGALEHFVLNQMRKGYGFKVGKISVKDKTVEFIKSDGGKNFS